MQSDHLPTPADLLLCPLTSTLIDAPLLRVTIKPSESSGLTKISQAMADKIGPARRDRIDGVIGRLLDSDMARIDAAMALMLDLHTD